MMKLKTEREINKICRYEKQWKIKTSAEKFKIIPIAQYGDKKFTIEGKEITSSKEGKVLGLTIQSTGIIKHATKNRQKATGVLNKLRRFANLTTKLKTTLVKTLILPVLEYPPIPQCSLSQSQKKETQRVQNKAIRFINHNEDRQTMEQLHRKYNLTPLNVSIHNKAIKTWHLMEYTQRNTFDRLKQQQQRSHKWFPKTTDIINNPQPNPIIT